MRFLPKLTPTRLARLGVVTWLVLLSALLIALSGDLSRMEQQHRQGSPDGQIAELQDRIDRLEAFEREVQAAPTSVGVSDFQQAQDQWRAQWDRLDQRLQDTTSAIELAALQERVDALAQHVTSLKPSPPQPTPNVSKPRARLSVPGFKALGIESRGGERFLAIQPKGTEGLDQVQLLRIGEAEGHWQLTALEGQTAVFTVDRKTGRLALPEE
ncbi:hypothetical protein AB3464_28665 [Pseudomonas asplenii]|uniref:hypothetical protein n=1 Tax=Pseudomonas asplenii TaxID=53407 RepID=UPI0037C9180B